MLDWNQPAIDFYLSIGAQPQGEWVRYRMEGEALTHFAAHGRRCRHNSRWGGSLPNCGDVNSLLRVVQIRIMRVCGRRE